MLRKITFEQHLIDKGLLTEEDVSNALLNIKHDNQSFCRTAIELGLLNVSDFFKIYSYQSNTAKSEYSIEEIAVNKGFLTHAQVKKIYAKIDETIVNPIDLLIQSTKISKDVVEFERSEFYNYSYKEKLKEQKKIKEMLMKFDIFSHLKDDMLEILSNIAVLENFKSGEIVIKEGSEADCIYCIASGTLSITSKDEHNKKVYISSLSEGAVLGEASIFEKGKRTATVTADSDSVLIRFDRYPFILFLRDYPKSSQSILIFIIQSLLQRLYLTNKDLAFERKDSISQDDIDSILKDFYKG